MQKQNCLCVDDFAIVDHCRRFIGRRLQDFNISAFVFAFEPVSFEDAVPILPVIALISKLFPQDPFAERMAWIVEKNEASRMIHRDRYLHDVLHLEMIGDGGDGTFFRLENIDCHTCRVGQ